MKEDIDEKLFLKKLINHVCRGDFKELKHKILFDAILAVTREDLKGDQYFCLMDYLHRNNLKEACGGKEYIESI